MGRIHTASLQMTWMEAPWDQTVCGFPVLQITAMEILGPNAAQDMQLFEIERDRVSAGMVSCRLSHERMLESILLEDRDFRFIEMVYQPELELVKFNSGRLQDNLQVARAGEGDLQVLLNIAGTSFHNERFKIDPRISPDVSDQRYRNWVSSSFQHPTQELYVICDGNRRVAFFVTELFDDGTSYWHLNAVAPDAQGQGYGMRAWLSMLNYASKRGAQRVRTSIVARNHKVLNLYARLGFYFPPPFMTFHWLKSKAE